ncbi:MAG: tetratricopeptide repeat protein, partial [Verrucomicrobiaceae bacterium]|nr:tetratricopeptide repeat protein [Verrucomicrobiaceae bacterium]
IQKQGDLIAQLLAEQKRLREAVGGTAEEIMKTAEENVAKANNQSVEEVRKGVQKALAEAKAEVAAAGADKAKLAIALRKLIDAESALGHENEVTTAMEQLQKAIDREAQPVEWAELTDKLVIAQKSRSLMSEEPIEMLKEAVQWAINSPKLGKEHQTTLTLMTSLAPWLPLEENIAMNREILKAQQKLHGPDKAETYDAMASLALALGNAATRNDDAAAAEEADGYYQKIIAAADKKFGPGSNEARTFIRHRCDLLIELGKLTEAEQLLTPVIADLEKKYGDSDPKLIRLLNALSTVRTQQKDFGAAIDIQRRLVEICKKAYGPDDESVINQSSGLAHTIWMAAVKDPERFARQLDEAENLSRNVLETKIRLNGASQPSTLSTFEQLSLILFEKGDIKGSNQQQQRRLEEMGKSTGPDDLGYAFELSHVGGKMVLRKDADSIRTGIKLLEQALAIREKKMPEKSAEIADDLESIAGAMLRLKEYGLAEPVLIKELALREKYHRKDTHSLALNYHNLSRTRSEAKKEAEALVYARKALDLEPENKLFKMSVDYLGSFVESPPETSPAPAPSSDKSPPSLEEYADFRKDINDRVKAGKLTKTRIALKAAAGREHYLEGHWTGDKLERAFVWNAKDTNNGTFTTFYLNQHGSLMSIFRLREGSDVPVEGVKKAGDTYNFLRGKLVGWRRTQDDAEKVEDPESEGFAEKGAEVYETGMDAIKLLLEEGPG